MLFILQHKRATPTYHVYTCTYGVSRMAKIWRDVRLLSRQPHVRISTRSQETNSIWLALTMPQQHCNETALQTSTSHTNHCFFPSHFVRVKLLAKPLGRFMLQLQRTRHLVQHSPSDSLHSVVDGQHVDPLAVLHVREGCHTTAETHIKAHHNT